MFQFFKLNVYYDDRNTLTVEDLYDNMLSMVESSLEKEVPVGLLTADNRDTWAESYQILERGICSKSVAYGCFCLLIGFWGFSDNKNLLKDIQSSLFVLSLDSICDVSEVNSQTKAALQMIHGGGSRCNAANRWFDKTIQVRVH